MRGLQRPPDTAVKLVAASWLWECELSHCVSCPMPFLKALVLAKKPGSMCHPSALPGGSFQFAQDLLRVQFLVFHLW